MFVLKTDNEERIEIYNYDSSITFADDHWVFVSKTGREYELSELQEYKKDGIYDMSNFVEVL
ncbi:MAG: hypothetical protein JHC33_03375 [Ignisphaera sp.]|nr:hypothetical protein [Ignisphaera sp.]